MQKTPKRNRRLLIQFSTVLAIISVLSVFFILQIVNITEESSGKGSAINISGSLRMQSYVMALAVAESSALTEPERRTTISEAVNEFQRRLLSPGLVNAIPTNPESSLAATYKHLKINFYETIKPLAEKAIVSPQGRQEFLDEIHTFVSYVDSFVFDLENELESRVNKLIFWLHFELVCIILIGIGVPCYLIKIIFSPIQELSELASEVRKGNFSKRSSYGKNNEIGELSQSFNFMIDDLSRLYSNLEEEVKEKTKDLDRRNRTLRLLYDIRSFLDKQEINKDVLNSSLERISNFFETNSISLVFHSGTANSMYVGARKVRDERFQNVNPLEVMRAHPESFHSASRFHCTYADLSFICQAQPIGNPDKVIGTLLMSSESETVEESEVELLKNIGSLFFSILEKSNQHDENFRLALYEERSTIARELHDSIAQSLAFSRIQLTRLTHAFNEPNNRENVLSIVEELKVGVATAYKQLREVLTTFRAVPQNKDFRQSLREILEDFTARTSVPYKLNNEVPGVELSPNQQIHLVQILREALANITKHAHATEVEVVFRPTATGRLELVVKDNGVGFDHNDKSGHFGLGIMRERAHAIGGELSITNNIPHGTQIKLEFESDN